MKPLHQLPVRWLTSMAAALLIAPVLAAEPAVLATAQTYQKDRTACLQGISQQDRATCLKEAGAAQAEAQRGRLGAGAGEDARTLTNNALQRCKSVPPEDRSACERMALGEGKVSGSVESGGVLKQITTYSVEPAASATPPPPSATR